MATATASTQVQNPVRTVIRTIFQLVVALAAAAPLLYVAIAQQEPELATGAAGIVIAVSAAITRVMALPVVDELLQTYVPWLASEPKEDHGLGR